MFNRQNFIAGTLAASGLIGALWHGQASAQDAANYPSRTVSIVVPYASGTGADILSRILGPMLSERWKSPVITDNRAGASGNIGAEYVSKAAPDGHTLLFTATSFGTVPALVASMPFDPIKSFTPVILLATGALCVVVNPEQPARSMREFVDSAKRQPGKLNYPSGGRGGPQHLGMELIKLELGIDVVHIPYKEITRGVVDLVTGQVQVMVSALQTVAPQVNAGKLRMLGVMSPERARAYPEVPSLKEQGMANLLMETWYGVFAPAGTPAAIVQKLNAELNENLKQATVRAVLAKQGLDAAGGPAERFGDLVKMEIPRWKRVAAAAGIKPE
ncbi:MAG: tripartite tricarboxylate transporter substrate binding protein [Betaproteobacteria bacterium]|nr:tripartite tricarboxylate transporter substrate binding protein [Betaproteobacteria bacterium]